jgi:hypothetical protein
MGWIDGTLDELEARPRALRREVDRLEREVAAHHTGDLGEQDVSPVAANGGGLSGSGG